MFILSYVECLYYGVFNINVEFFFIEVYFIYEIHSFRVCNLVIFKLYSPNELKRVRVSIPLPWSSRGCYTVDFAQCSLDLLSGVVGDYVTTWHCRRI